MEDGRWEMGDKVLEELRIESNELTRIMSKAKNSTYNSK